MVCSILAIARSVALLPLTSFLLAAIRNTEETFLEGGDITMRIHDLKAMADGIGGHGGDDVSESTGGGGEKLSFKNYLFLRQLVVK